MCFAYFIYFFIEKEEKEEKIKNKRRVFYIIKCVDVIKFADKKSRRKGNREKLCPRAKGEDDAEDEVKVK